MKLFKGFLLICGLDLAEKYRNSRNYQNQNPRLNDFKQSHRSFGYDLDVSFIDQLEKDLLI
jgi:hypothetical protein